MKRNRKRERERHTPGTGRPLPTCGLKAIYRQNKLINYGRSENPLRSVNQISGDDGGRVFGHPSAAEASIKKSILLRGRIYGLRDKSDGERIG